MRDVRDESLDCSSDCYPFLPWFSSRDLRSPSVFPIVPTVPTREGQDSALEAQELSKMALRRLYAPLRPDLDNFLFAAVGQERNGIPLSMISALTQLDLDPWDEAGRLSSMAKQEAVDRLTGLILRLPEMDRPSSEVEQVAAGLIDTLPGHVIVPRPTEETRRGPKKIAPGNTFWMMIFLAFGAAAFLLMVTQGDSPFSNHRPPSAIDATEKSKLGDAQ